MDKIKELADSAIAVLAALCCLVVLAAPIRSSFAQQSPTRVTVVNRPVHPVPTSVVNPATNPVPTSIVNPATMPALTSNIDDPGRSAFQSTSVIGSCTGSNECEFSFTVPSQHRLVVQSVSGFLGISGTTTEILARLGTKVAFLPPLSAINRISAFVQPLLFYADPGSITLLLDLIPNTATLTSAPEVTLTGYLLDCAASPCAPIAQ